MKRAAIVLFFVGLLALPMRLASQNAEQNHAIEKQLAGSWKLISYVRHDIASGARSNVMGEQPSGYIHYGDDGRMMVIIVGSGRKKPVGPVATPEEAEALIRSMLAYAGTYSVDAEAHTVTHHIDVSWDQSRTGESQLRSYKLDGDSLTLTTPPSIDPATGEKTVRTLIWQKLK